MSVDQVDIDMRQYPRVSEDCEVSYTLVEEEPEPQGQDGLGVNISGGGMCFSSIEPLPVGGMIALQVNLPQLPNPIVALAKVSWCRMRDDASRYDNGVEFWWIGWRDVEAQEAMLDYVKAKLKRAGAV